MPETPELRDLIHQLHQEHLRRLAAIERMPDSQARRAALTAFRDELLRFYDAIDEIEGKEPSGA